MAELSGGYEPIAKATDEELKRRGHQILFAACSGDVILTGSSRPLVKLWRLTEGGDALASEASLKLTAPPSCIQCSKDQNRVAVCVQDGTILLFDLRESHQSPQVISTAMAESNCVAFLDDIRFAAGGCSGKISLWDLRRMSLEEEIPAYMENGDSKWEGGQAPKRRRSGAASSKVTDVFRESVSCLCTNHDGSLLACGRASGSVGLLRLPSLQWVTADLQAHTSSSAAVRSLSFDQRSKVLLSGGDDRTICLMDASDWVQRRRKPPVERFPAHSKRITAVQVCPDPSEQLVVSASWDGLVKLWDLQTQQLRQKFDHRPSPVTAVAFAPIDGRFFVTGGGDASLVLYAKR